MPVVKRSALATWLWSRLFAVGFATGLPFLFLVGIDADYSRAPAIARVLDPLLIPLLLAAPFVVGAAMLIVDRQSKAVKPPSAYYLAPHTLVVLGGVMLYFSMFSDTTAIPYIFDLPGWLLRGTLIAMLSVGVLATAVALGRLRWWLGLAWPLAWCAFAAAARFAALDVRGDTDDYGLGMIILALFAALLVGSAVGSSILSAPANASESGKRLDTRRALIEPAD